MGIFKRLVAAVNQSTWDKYVRDFLSGNDLSPNGDINLSGDNALKYSVVFGCLRVLAETFASVPVFEYRKIDDSDREKTDDTGLYDVLHNVTNDEMSAYSFKEMGMYQINCGGNLVCLRENNRLGQVIGLKPYRWNQIDIKRNKESNKLEYTIDRKAEFTYTRDKVFHVAGPSLDGITGMSPLEYASQAIKLGVSYETFGLNFYKNGAAPSGIFKHPGMLKDEAFKRLKEDIKGAYQGLANSGTPIIAEDGLDFVQLSIKPVDAQLLECKKFQIEDICRIYRVPLHLVQNLDKATNNNIEHQSLEFVMYTMLPHFKRWEDAINSQLLNSSQRKAGYYFEFNLSALLRGDAKSMAEAFAQGRQWGWLSVNDIRRMLNMNKIDNGDIYLQPMNMIEAGKQVVEDQNKRLVDEIRGLIETSAK